MTKIIDDRMRLENAMSKRTNPFRTFFGQPIFRDIFYKAVIGTLLIFTGWRVVDLVSKTLPEEATALAIVSVTCFGGGILIWKRAATHRAKSLGQVWLAWTMVVIDFIGEAILFVSHIILNENFYVLKPETLITTGTVALWTIAIGILVNIAAWLVMEYLDPDEQMLRAKRDMEIEIKRRAIELVNAKNEAMADEIAPSLAGDTIAAVRGALMRPSLPPPMARESFPMPQSSPVAVVSEGEYRPPRNGRRQESEVRDAEDPLS